MSTAPPALFPNGKHLMTLHTPDQLFSHPETHSSHATPSALDADQPSWTNLFQEPVPAQRPSSEH